MKKATRDFAAWIRGIDGLEKATRAYESGRITLMEYIMIARSQEQENINALYINETDSQRS